MKQQALCSLERPDGNHRKPDGISVEQYFFNVGSDVLYPCMVRFAQPFHVLCRRSWVTTAYTGVENKKL